MSETNERSVASDGSVTGDIVERLNRAGDLASPGEPCGLFYDAADEIERLRLTDAELRAAVRALLDGVNARYPDKNPREWTCPHMAELDRLVPPNGDK